jgi:hypothetical protein
LSTSCGGATIDLGLTAFTSYNRHGLDTRRSLHHLASLTLARKENQMPYSTLVDLVVVLIVVIGAVLWQMHETRRPK